MDLKLNLKNALNQKGSAIIAVLVLLTAGGFIASLLFDQLSGSLRRWKNDYDYTQAFYLAESGISHELYLVKYGNRNAGDFSRPGNENDEPDDSSFLFMSEFIQFHLREDLPAPKSSSSEEGRFIQIISSSDYKSASVEIQARFGRALTGQIFSSALVLTGNIPLSPVSFGNITGIICSKTLSPGNSENEHTLPKGFTIQSLLGDFSNNLDNHYRSELEFNLSREGGTAGNGYFNSGRLPDFSETGDIFFPLGDLYIDHSGNGCLEIAGKGIIYVNGDVFIKGCVVLKDIKILAGRNIYFEDTVSSLNLTVYSGKNIYISDRSNLDIQATAQENIFMGGTSQTSVNSMLLSIGRTGSAAAVSPKLESLSPTTEAHHMKTAAKAAYGIRLSDQAIARGMLLSPGLDGTMVMNSSENLIEGLVIANKSAWVTGLVKGVVITEILRCSQNILENCLDAGKINRKLMPYGITLPLNMGNTDRSEWEFKLADWRVN